MDLAGGGLQSANLRLARLLKRRRIAYALLILFPFGAHRLYLEDRRGALLDLRWIDNALARINKRLRIEVYMSQTAGAPAGYRGRFAADPAGDDSPREDRALSFSEQERQLRDAARRHRDNRQ